MKPIILGTVLAVASFAYAPPRQDDSSGEQKTQKTQKKNKSAGREIAGGVGHALKKIL